jgi:hypothetical protein
MDSDERRIILLLSKSEITEVISKLSRSQENQKINNPALKGRGIKPLNTNKNWMY